MCECYNRPQPVTSQCLEKQYCRLFSWLRMEFSVSGGAELSRTVMKKNIPTANDSIDVTTAWTNIFDGQWCILIKRALCIIGQWPYQSDREKRLKFLFILLVSLSVMIPQVGNTSTFPS